MTAGELRVRGVAGNQTFECVENLLPLETSLETGLSGRLKV